MLLRLLRIAQDRDGEQMHTRSRYALDGRLRGFCVAARTQSQWDEWAKKSPAGAGLG